MTDVKRGSEIFGRKLDCKDCLMCVSCIPTPIKKSERISVVPEEKWESKEEHTEKLEEKLARIKALIENSLRTKQENLKLYNQSEPIYAKICGEIAILEKLRKVITDE